MKPSTRIDEIHQSLYKSDPSKHKLEDLLIDMAARSEAITKYLDEQSEQKKEGV